ncbi:uncharacterized protein LOC127862324 [Dreissena polymorpha]|uniref:uncharacterized protein LOC127862324 n=1 Tax=Dreissena polymorpha TaxID=45954 RepID=UPI0022642744|nr:uncharacterized protein LOC127862324 [Dreissena polymorpha]
MGVPPCDSCPYTPACGPWGPCSVTCGDGIMYQQTMNGSCKSLFPCNNGTCLDIATSVVTTLKATTNEFESEESSETVATTSSTDIVTTGPTGSTTLAKASTNEFESKESSETVATTSQTDIVTNGRTGSTTLARATTNEFESEESSGTVATTSPTDVVTIGRTGSTTMARGTATQVNNVTNGATVPNIFPPVDPMLTIKVAVPLIAAVVLIAAVLVFIFLRRKRRNGASQLANALDSLENVPGEGKNPYSAGNVAFTPGYDMTLKDREYNYVQSQSSEKGLSDYTNAEPTKSHQASEENVGGMKNAAASSDTEYDYTCAKQITLVGHDQAVYNHLSIGQP